MRPPRLRRSITFWSGIFVMIFFAWGWWDSFRNYSMAYMRDRIEIDSTQGMILFAEAHQIEPWGGKRFKRTQALPTKIFPGPLFLRGGGDTLGTPAQYQKWDEEMKAAPDQATRVRLDMRTFPRDQIKLMIPHWLFLLTVALLWSGMLLWRARRVRLASGGSE